MDDGRLTDAQGRTVDFKNSVIIMTSNIGSTYLTEGVNPSGEIGAGAKDAVMAELRRHFRPEFLNRVDDIVFFKPLTMDEIEAIVDLLVEELRERLRNRQIDLDVSARARSFAARKGFNPVFGARPLRRFLQQELETRIGRALISGSIPDGSSISVDMEEGELAVRHRATRHPGERILGKGVVEV